MKVGIREICDVVFKAKSNITVGGHTFKAGEPVIYFDTLKTSIMGIFSLDLMKPIEVTVHSDDCDDFLKAVEKFIVE